MLDHFYIGSYTEEIVGYSTAIVIISTPEGEKKIQLKRAAYVLSFYIDLVCL